jgi:maltooligosyltrehalose trehalohydrolase
VEVVFENGPPAVLLRAEEGGYFSGEAAVGAGTRYRFRLAEKPDLYPDPASRFQPEGPHGPSEVIDPAAFAWTDHDWGGCRIEGQIVYELHVGTFTRQGTWQAAREQLPRLADLGISLIEVMPVADFPGTFGWGYDGVNLFAPTRLYGRPDDFRTFVDRAHALGLGVILDVVYNHLGPAGNYLPLFAPAYFSSRHKTDWGAAINFDGPDAGPVREFFLTNAAYWIAEFHLDGLRLDATQTIFDDNPGEHILAAVARVTRAAAQGRAVVLIAENEPEHTQLVRPLDQGGYGLDALWNDDFHHSARVAATGRKEAYYTDYRGRPQEFISTVKYGPLWQGQWYTWQKQPRGTPAFGVPPAAFVNFLDNHDQVANSALSLPLSTRMTGSQFRTLTALLLLSPGTPMLFQGQEFASSAPFYFFADHQADLADKVARGRRKFMAQFASLADPHTAPPFPVPHDRATFERCRLDEKEREQHGWAIALHRDLIALRRHTPAFAAQRAGAVDGAVLGEEAFVLRFFSPEGDRLLLINLGRELHLEVMPDPLLAPPAGQEWQLLWSSEDPRYGGEGIPQPSLARCWVLPAHSATVLGPARRQEEAR